MWPECGPRRCQREAWAVGRLLLAVSLDLADVCSADIPQPGRGVYLELAALMGLQTSNAPGGSIREVYHWRAEEPNVSRLADGLILLLATALVSGFLVRFIVNRVQVHNQQRSRRMKQT
jgi:hypothetical protein